MTDAVLEVSKHVHRNFVEDWNRTKHHKKDRVPILDEDDERLQPGHAFFKGAQIFSSAKWFELNEQVRAAEDEKHKETVLKQGKGESIALSDLEICPELSTKDLLEECWLRAPMIAATNHEKLLMTHHRCLQLSRFIDRPVIRWRSRVISCGTGEALWDETDPAHHECFLQSADACLTENVHKNLGLVNALKMRLHSLIPSTEEDCQTLLEAAKAGNGGRLFELQSPPKAVNVEVSLASLKKLPSRTKAALQQISTVAPNQPRNARPCSAEDGDTEQDSESFIVFPCGHCHVDPQKTMHVFPLEEPLNVCKDACVQHFFPIEMAFAIAVNKAEGQTLDDGVIVALSARGWFEFNHAGLHVGASRVKHRDKMRLLISGSTPAEKKRGLQHLEKLRPKPSIRAFFEGCGGEWKEDTWNTKEHCPLDALMWLFTSQQNARC